MNDYYKLKYSKDLQTLPYIMLADHVNDLSLFRLLHLTQVSLNYPNDSFE